MAKHLGTYLTDDQAIAHILGLKQLKKAPVKINSSEPVSINKKLFIVTCTLTLTQASVLLSHKNTLAFDNSIRHHNKKMFLTLKQSRKSWSIWQD